MSSFGDFGTAFVHVVPDARGFQAELQRQVDQAVRNVRVPPVQAQAQVSQVAVQAGAQGAAATEAVAATEALAAAQTQAAAASAKQEAESLALNRALAVQARAERTLATAIKNKASEQRIADLTNRKSIADQAVLVAGLRQSEGAESRAAAASREVQRAQAQQAAELKAVQEQTVQTAAAKQGLAVTEGEVAAASAKEAAAALAVTRALREQAVATTLLNEKTVAGAGERELASLQTRVNLANKAVQVAQLRQGEATQATQAAAAREVERAEAALAAELKLVQEQAILTAAAQKGLAVTETEVTGTSAREAAASLTLTRALREQAVATTLLSERTAAGASAQELATLQTRANLANQAVQVAQLRKTEVEAKAANDAAGGLATRNKVLQGSLIGLTRITPVAVFGLGVYGTAAIAAGLALKASVSAAADFEQQLNTFQAVTGSTGDEMDQVADKARALGSDLTLPGQSALDAAVGMTELAKAGLSVNDTLAASKGVLQLATAANIDVGQAANIAATQLNAFQLSGDQATRVAELLADASIAAQGEITDFSAGFQQVAAVANQVGLSVEDTTVLLTELGKAGLKGADGGTSLRTTLLRLVPTTKEAQQYVEALGIQIDKTRSIGEQITSVIEQYRTQLQLLTPVQQQQVLTQIFGQDAIRAASIIFGQQANELQRLRAEFEKTNSLQALTEAKSRGLKGAANNLSSELETLGLNVGSLTTGPLAALLNELANGVGKVNEFADAIRNLSADIRKIDVPDITVPIHFELFGHKVDETAHPFKVLGDFVVGSVKKTAAQIKDTAEAGMVNVLFPGAGSAMQVIEPRIHDVYDRIAGTAEKEAQAAQERIAAATAKMVQAGIVDETTRAGQEFAIPKRPDESAVAAGVADAGTITPAERKQRAKIAALAKEQAEKQKLQIPIPVALQQALVDAQLAKNLQAEKAADDKIAQFLIARRDRLKEGTEKFLVVSGQILQAQQARDQVQSEIDGNAKKAADDREKKAKDAENARKKSEQDAANALRTSLSNEQARLELAATAANNRGAAERKLIAFLRKEASDTRLTTAEQLQFAKALQAEQGQQASAITAAADAETNYQKSLLDFQLRQAQILTPNDTTDDKRILNRQLKFWQDQMNAAKKLGKAGRDAVLEAKNQILTITDAIDKLKNDPTGQGGGFTLAQLFQEAASEFQQFGSNIAGPRGVLSGQDARAAFSQTVQANAVSQIPQQQLSQAQQQTVLLAGILAAVQKGGGQLRPADLANQLGRTGSLTAAEASRLAASYGFSVN